VDLAAGLIRDHVESVHVIEVKGSLADLAREDLGDGKWALDYAALGINPWLAVVDTIGPGHLETLPRAWGLLSVAGDGRVRELRVPEHVVDTAAHAPDDNVTGAYRALAQVLTAQALPTLFAADTATALELMAERGVDRPWRQWSEDKTQRRRRHDDDVYEDTGSKIL
jgi:hypothetical protein